MDGERVQQLFKQEVNAMLEVYRNFETLIPSPTGRGAQHKGEDGRFVENLIRSFLVRFLPKELEVLTGFILRPAVKTGKTNKSRKCESDRHSTQLDIIVYNSAQYPIFIRSNDTVIVPPEGVISIISVKKTLNDKDINDELNALKEASKLCRCGNLRQPYLALVSMDNNIKKQDTHNWIFQKMKNLYDQDSDISFDDMVGYVGAFKEWSIFKSRPKKTNLKEAKYILFEHNRKEDNHHGLQFLLTGILSVYYDKSRTILSRPGFTAFDHKKPKVLGSITSQIEAIIND